MAEADQALSAFHPPVRAWFEGAFSRPTRPQTLGWAPIRSGEHTLLLAPTGSGKTLAAFLSALDRLMFTPKAEDDGVRVLYVSPLKALGVDVERNLRAPIAGVRTAAERMGSKVRVPEIGIRSGDTPQSERARMNRKPPDILITTPESLYLMLTSAAREVLRDVHTCIIDEIHSMVPTKRGAHLFTSLERLERNLREGGKMQRIGLSATQRPLDEVARLLGGAVVRGGKVEPRPVTIVNAGRKKAFDLSIEVPVEDMRLPDAASTEAAPGEEDFPVDEAFMGGGLPSGPAAQGPTPKSIWPSIHPRLVELIRAHRSTMIFVNSRRLAERLSAALNEEAAEPLTRAHHGSIAKDTRAEIEDSLKRGELKCIIATSSLELGVDMGAVDLVVQVEAPPSVASGMQRAGRAGHTAGSVSKAIVFPKYRGDLIACAAVAERMHEAKVEETFYPRNPLDVLAQQVVAAVSMDAWTVDDLYDLMRSASPFAELPRSAFEGVLDMLSGRYPSEAFAELRPRVTWDRITGQLEPRKAAKRIAIVNGGTIPDRGLYGVFLAGEGPGRRVGELDEEMVFESRPGDVFLLGASSWRIEDITPDQVLVTPAPGEPGKMPFWHGDRPGRPLEMGRAIGALTRRMSRGSKDKHRAHLVDTCGLDARAAENLLTYIEDQREAAQHVPTDRDLVVERFTDEIGDWRVCVLSPFGARVHAPWATAVARRLRGSTDAEIDVVWSDDGMVFRLPEADAPPDPELFFPSPKEVEALVVEELGSTSLFSARFRENAARSLLLPRRSPGKRSPLWAQRRKSAQLLSVASGYDGFPVILETYRECLKDVFDLPGLSAVLSEVQARSIRVHTVDSRTPSPFSASLLFTYVANFIYDGDAPLAERRAQILSIDHAQLRELLGEAELRELLDLESIEAHEARLQRLELPLTHVDDVHDALLELGDLTPGELAQRAAEGVDLDAWLQELVARRRVVRVRIANEERYIPAELASRYRDALGVALPPGLPEAFLEGPADPLLELLARYARTHGPFPASRVQDRYGLPPARVSSGLGQLVERGQLLEGEFLPGGRGLEFCDPEVLQALKRKALAKLRKEVEPVDPTVLGRFLPDWHGATRPSRGLDAVLGAIETMQGAPLPASAIESDILPSRVDGYSPRDLDELCAAGEVIWRGLAPLGTSDARIALYLTDHYPRLAPPPAHAEGEAAQEIRALLGRGGALFFSDITSALEGFPRDRLDALWALVWSGEVTNDTLAPLRALQRSTTKSGTRPRGRGFRSRRSILPGSEGRWSLLRSPLEHGLSATERSAALARQLLERHGVVTREAVQSEGITGGFSAVYPVLQAMEAAGKVRRGYFVAGLGAAQFALPGADDRLRRAERARNDDDEAAVVLSAADPANPYGAAVRWPDKEGARPQRAAGALVILFRGRLIGWVGRTEKTVTTFLPEHDPERSAACAALARALADLASRGGRRALLVGKIDGQAPDASPLAPWLERAGFGATRTGFVKRRSLQDA